MTQFDIPTSQVERSASRNISKMFETSPQQTTNTHHASDAKQHLNNQQRRNKQQLTNMCDCFSKLARSHENMESTEVTLHHLVEVIAKHFTNEKPVLYFKALDFVCEAYERVAIKQSPTTANSHRHSCDEVERLITYISEVDRFHHHLEEANFQRSPRLSGRMRRALFKDLHNTQQDTRIP